MKGCKKCPAFDKCTVTHRGSACAALRGSYGLDTDPEIITNADRIRAMSDDELAKWLCSIMTAECCDRSCPARDICNLGDRGLVKWMKQPADETTL